MQLKGMPQIKHMSQGGNEPMGVNQSMAKPPIIGLNAPN